MTAASAGGFVPGLDSQKPLAVTTSVPSTAQDQIGAALGQIFTDPRVVGSIAGTAGSILDAGLAAIGIGGGKTPDQIKAEAAAAAERQKAEQMTMLIIGGGVAVVIIIVVVIAIRRK